MMSHKYLPLMEPLTISAYTLTTALGRGVASNWKGIRGGQTGLKPCDFHGISDLNTWVGEVDGVSDHSVQRRLKAYSCRNNQLADLALEQDGFSDAVNESVNKYGAERVAIFIGTSTSGIRQTEMAYAERQKSLDTVSSLPDWYNYSTTHNLYSPVEYVRLRCGLQGVCMTISTACSSSAKVFACAQRAIAEGLCDAALVGGVDSLCYTTLYGFNSLQVVSEDICRPSDRRRSGISIGEGAGFALLEKCGSAEEGVLFLGFGESADAHHMSTPHPEGKGALLAMRAALQRANLQPDIIDYINLHGTGTVANDIAEAIAVTELFGERLPCSSTKGWTGHTLGAAGIIEALFSVMCVKNNFLPQSLNTQEIDPRISSNILLEPQDCTMKAVMSNSMGFGGSNCALVFGKIS